MRILQVNKFNYARGGADKYFLDLCASLKEAGHDVAIFSMEHPNNLASDFSKYFVSRLSFNESTLLDKIKTPGRVIYSLEAKRKFKKLLNDFKPDIIHIHNIYHQISPSILDVARNAKIPVVMHLHDYKLICPNYQLFTQGRPCGACKPNKYYQCIKNKCFKNSCSKSCLASLEMYIHHNILKIYEKSITEFIAPSNFMKQKLIEFSWPENKIKVIINPFPSLLSDHRTDDKTEKYLLYFGRLSSEKGLDTLIKAAALTHSRLKFAGLGPEMKKLKREADNLKVDLEFLGFKSGNELTQIILNAEAVVLPSIWYENMPLSLLEAMSLGKMVIASNIGGIPEIITDKKNGLLFKAGDENDLASKIKSLTTIPQAEIKNDARESVKEFTLENNTREVINLYRRILNK